MKTNIRNFVYTFKRFITANLLNLFGLSLAFASFIVIMMQVNYDYSYNKCFKDYERLYYCYLDLGSQYENFGQTISRPMCENLSEASPHITDYAIIQGFSLEMEVDVDGQKSNIDVYCSIKGTVKAFEPKMIVGSVETLNQKDHILLPRKVAERLFGSIDCMNKTLKIERGTLTVSGIFEDFPENCMLGGMSLIGVDENDGVWNNWNYQFYVRLDDTSSLEDTQKMMTMKVKEYANSDATQEELDAIKAHLVNIGDLHFAKIKGEANSNSTITYLLLCFSVLIIVIAAVNFMNFTLAETPMRIRSINTQKVLGASTMSLRFGLLVEAVLVSIISFLIGIIWIYVANEFGLQELVQAKINITDHPLLLGFTFALSIVVGLVSGIYPCYYATSFPPALVLKGSFGLSPKGRALRTFLIGVQFVISFVLIIGVGIMYLQSHYIRTSDYGYDKDQVLTFSPRVGYTMDQSDAVISELNQIPGVESVSISNSIMGSSDSYMGWGRGEGEQSLFFTCFPVDYRYLKTMGIKVVEGRDFNEFDQDVYIFNEAAKREYSWLEVDKPIVEGDFPIIGFCEDIRYSSFRNERSKPMAFIIFGKDGRYKDWNWKNFFNVRISKGVDRVALLQKIKKTMDKFEPSENINFRFFDQVLGRAYYKELRFTKQVLLFSLLAILISIIGVFGLTMFESEYRRKEIGVRKIFGSSTRQILSMFNKHYLKLLLFSFVVAAPVGYYFGQDWLKGFADKTIISPLLFVVSFLLVVAITMATVTYQSWKNANENPVNSIKTE